MRMQWISRILAHICVQDRHQRETPSGGSELIANHFQKIVYKDPESRIELTEFMPASEGMLSPDKLVQIGFGNQGYVYKCDGGFAHRQYGRDEESRLMIGAGELSITPYSCVLRPIEDFVAVDAIIMGLGSPLGVKRITSSSARERVKDEMTSLVTRLHAKGIAHGDIGLMNFLRAQEDTLSVCDFDTSFYLDGHPQEWEGGCSPRHISPNRASPDCKLPSIENGMYALTVSVWRL